MSPALLRWPAVAPRSCFSASTSPAPTGRRRAPSPAPSIDRRATAAQLAQLVERVPPVAGVGAHLAGPAPSFGGLRPFAADQHMGPVDLVERRIARTILRDPLLLPADVEDERLTRHAGRGMDARHLQKIGYVLAVVDLVEQRLLVGVDVHADDEQIFRRDRHRFTR